MSNARNTAKVANLELNKETLQELTESESEQAQGGAKHISQTCMCREACEGSQITATC